MGYSAGYGYSSSGFGFASVTVGFSPGSVASWSPTLETVYLLIDMFWVLVAGVATTTGVATLLGAEFYYSYSSSSSLSSSSSSSSSLSSSLPSFSSKLSLAGAS